VAFLRMGEAVGSRLFAAALPRVGAFSLRVAAGIFEVLTFLIETMMLLSPIVVSFLAAISNRHRRFNLVYKFGKL